MLLSGVQFGSMSVDAWGKVHAATRSNLLISRHLEMLDINSPSLQMLKIEAGFVQVALQICHRIPGFLTRLLAGLVIKIPASLRENMGMCLVRTACELVGKFSKAKNSLCESSNSKGFRVFSFKGTSVVAAKSSTQQELSPLCFVLGDLAQQHLQNLR